MLKFDTKPLKKVTLKSTTTHELSSSNYVKSNNYLPSPSIQNDTTSDRFGNTTYEVYAPSIDNKWEDYGRNDG